MGYKSDLYVHSACIREISKLEFPPGNAMIDGNAPDIHYGPYIVLLGYVYAITKIDPIISLYFAGIINLILFIYFFFNFIKERFNENIAIFSTLSALFVWGGYDSYAGIYYLADSYNYFYPQGVGYTLLFASLFFLIRAMNNDKYKLYCIISSFLLFTTHILTGVLYFLLVYLYLVSLYISKKVEKKYYLFVFVVPFITIVLSLLWPYYSISYLIKNKILSSSLIANVITPSHESPGGYYFNLSYYAATAGLSIIGIFGLYNLVKNRRLFFPLWFISCILILLNKDIPFYGRFLFFSIFPLHIGCGIIFNKIDINLPKLKKYIILFIVLIVVTSSFCIKIKNSAINPPLDYSFIIKNTEEDSVILSDVYTSFTIPGLTSR
ncbi:MAG TPA: hypothetical protein ENI51_08285, partial [Candidatus Atribacteria bacterium]|nr:hypothetical protein [Candidatus Atribacteria bacterium]